MCNMNTDNVAREIVRTAYALGYSRGRADLKDCINELCLLCGRYKMSHLGACDDCRWKDEKEMI